MEEFTSELRKGVGHEQIERTQNFLEETRPVPSGKDTGVDQAVHSSDRRRGTPHNDDDFQTSPNGELGCREQSEEEEEEQERGINDSRSRDHCRRNSG